MAGQKRNRRKRVGPTSAPLRTAVAIVASIGITAAVARAQDASAGGQLAGGVYSTEQADRGRAVFDGKCQSCHGAAFEGGTLAPALTGREFLSAFQQKPLRRIYSRIISTMPPDDIGSLTERETLALVALLLRANGYPAGPEPLARADDLNAIVVVPPPEKQDPATWNAETADNGPL